MSGSPKEVKLESEELSHIRFLWSQRIEVLAEFDRNKRQWPYYSTLGYAIESKDKQQPVNVVRSNKVDMKSVPHDVVGVADTGQTIWMTKNERFPYQFPGAKWIHLTAIRPQQQHPFPKQESKNTSPSFKPFPDLPINKKTSSLSNGGKTIVGKAVVLK